MRKQDSNTDSLMWIWVGFTTSVGCNLTLSNLNFYVLMTETQKSLEMKT